MGFALILANGIIVIGLTAISGLIFICLAAILVTAFSSLEDTDAGTIELT